MSEARRRVQQSLAARELVTGVGLDYASLPLARFLAQEKFDLVFIDCEHAGPGIERVADLVIAVHAGGGVAVLRPWSADPGLVRRYIDTGIDGLIFPQIESARQVRAVRTMIAEAAPDDEASMILIGLIESAIGVEKIDEILQEPGLSAILVGPADLAVSYGLPRRGRHDSIRDKTLFLLGAARKAGRAAGVPIGRYDLAAVRAAGANLLMYSARDLLGDGIVAAREALAAAVPD